MVEIINTGVNTSVNLMANQTFHTKHYSQNEQPLARNPTLSSTPCQKVLNFLYNQTQLLKIQFGGWRYTFSPKCVKIIEIELNEM